MKCFNMFSRTRICISSSSLHFDYVSTKHIAYVFSFLFFCCLVVPLPIYMQAYPDLEIYTAGEHHWSFRTSSAFQSIRYVFMFISFHTVDVTLVGHFSFGHVVFYLCRFDNRQVHCLVVGSERCSYHFRYYHIVATLYLFSSIVAGCTRILHIVVIYVSYSRAMFPCMLYT